MATSTTKIPYVEGAAPATPATGEVVTYAKADGLMYSKDDAGTETLMSGGASGSLTDHTHAATGSGATGGGATLDPVNLNLPTASPATTDGRVGWDATLRALRVFDSVQAKHATPVGWEPFAMQDGVSAFNEFNVGSTVLAAVSGGNAGALGVWIRLNGPMKLDSYAVWSNDTASARSLEGRLYVDRLNNSTSLNFVAGTDATWSFTPGAASRRVSGAVSGAPVYLPPGRYFLVVRNTSATQTFSVGRTTQATNRLVLAQSALLATASIAALGSTFDITTLTSKSDPAYGVMMLGRIGGQATAW